MHDQINDWMCQNCLQLNKEQTELMVFCATNKQEKGSFHLQLKMADPARNLVLVIDVEPPS